MKIKITRPDGTTIEAEGTAEECARLVGETPTHTSIPYAVPYPSVQPWEPTPWQPGITWQWIPSTSGGVTVGMSIGGVG